MAKKELIARVRYNKGIPGGDPDTGKVYDFAILPAADHTDLAIYGNTGEIAYMLIGARKLIEESGLTAILISD